MKSDISAGIVGMGSGNQDFYVEHLGGKAKSRFLRDFFEWDHGNDICTGKGIYPSFREILGEFFCGNVPEDCPYFHKTAHYKRIPVIISAICCLVGQCGGSNSCCV